MQTKATSCFRSVSASIPFSFSFNIFVSSRRLAALVKDNVLMNYQVFTRNVLGDIWNPLGDLIFVDWELETVK